MNAPPPLWRRAWGGVARSRVARLWAGTARAVKPAAAPLEPWLPPVEVDARFADEMYHGRLRLAGHRAELHGTSPFDHPGPPQWQAALHGFGWLRPLVEADTPLSRANAQAQVADWIEFFGTRLAHPAWTPEVAATRLDSWLTHGAWLADGMGADATQRFRRSVAFHVRALRALRPAANRLARAEVGGALALAQALTGGGASNVVSRREIAELPQAGLRAALLLWSRLARAHEAAGDASGGGGVAAPELAGWLAAQQHASTSDGGGAFARFVQDDRPFAPVPQTLRDALRGAAPSSRNPLVAHREADGAVLLVARGVTANVGAFELSDGRGRVVCSCGRGEVAPALSAALSSPRAHSTLTLEAFAQPDETPSVPSVARVDGEPVKVTHDRFRDFGVTHTRMLDLATDGLNGADTLSVSTRSDREVVVRFHLHPDVRPRPRGDNAVQLVRGGEVGWTFFCLDAPVSLEETALFAEGGAPVPSRQIVLRRPLNQGGEIRWAFARSAPARERVREAAAEA